MKTRKQSVCNFTEAGHGKSPADGIGGSLKKQADDQVKYGHDIQNIDTLVETLRTRVKNTYLNTVTKDDIEYVDTKLPLQIHTFAGTMKVHQYTWSTSQPTVVFFNSLSCSECAIGSECKHYSLGSLTFSTDTKKVVKQKAGQKRKLTHKDETERTSTKKRRKKDYQHAAFDGRKFKKKTKAKDIPNSESTPQRKSLP